MSTRRARIKAVAALPQRRKNVEKKQVEDVKDKDGFEANLIGVKPVRQLSVEKSPKKRRLSIEFEDGMPSRLRRMSVDKSPRGCQTSLVKTSKECLSQDKPANGYEDGIQMRARRISTDKMPQHHLSLDEKDRFGDGKRLCRISEKSLHGCRTPVEKTPQHRLSIDKTATEEDAVQTMPRRLSTDKTPHHHFSIDKPLHSDNASKECRVSFHKTKHQLPIDKTPDRKSLIEIICQELRMPTTESIQNEVLFDCSANDTLVSEQSTCNKAKTNEIDATGSISIEAKNLDQPSTSKVNCNVEKDTNNLVPFFASPDPLPRPSIIVHTPVIEVDLSAEKFIVPHKGPQSEYIQISYKEKLQKKIVPEKTLITPEDLDENVKKIDKSECQILESALSGGSKKAKDQIKIINDYVIKPLPEVSPIMDGIVPLKPARNIPKPIDMLKNEIISDNAQVLFDPIVPLPSPTKARPKLRPAPRLAPRRNSIQQGSASESEDDNRRSLHGGAATPIPSRQRDSHTPVPARQRHDSYTPTPVRQRHDSQTHPRQRHDSQTSQAQPLVQRDVARVRNDSVCSNASQAASQITAVGSPVRERQRSRREEQARRNAAMRKRASNVDRNKLTMYDLIFYNPTSKPIIPDEDELKAKEANEKDKIEAVRKAEADKESGNVPQPAPVAVPQIKLGPNGEIILDEQSLVVNQFDQRKLDASVIREGAWAGSSTSSAYRRTPRTADWSDAETLRFYRALASLGTDFSMMVPLFPTRTRRDLKLKFKKEERSNLAQVDKALRAGAKFDPTGLEKEFNEERRLAEEAEKRAKERLQQEKEEEKQRKSDMKNLKVKASRCAKSLGRSAMPDTTFDAGKTTPSTFDEYVKFQEDRKKKPKVPSKRKRGPNVRGPNVPTGQKQTVSLSPIRSPSPSLAALRLLERHNRNASKTPTETVRVAGLEVASRLPANLEPGSVVLMTVNDPQSPSTQVLHAFYAKGQGEFATVDPTLIGGLLNKTNSPQRTASPRVRQARPRTPTYLPLIPEPSTSRNRKSSYTITQL